MEFENDEQAKDYLRAVQALNPPEPEYEPFLIGDLVMEVFADVLERNGAK